MRLLFVSQFIARPDEPGQNRIYDFLQRLADAGHDVRVVTCGLHYIRATIDPELARRKFLHGRWGRVEVTTTYASPGFRAGIVARLRSYLSFAWYAFRACLRVERPDALMVSVQPMFVAPLAWIVSRLRRARFLLEVRDLWPDTAIALGAVRSRLVVFLARRLEMFVYRSADRIVVIGPEMKRRIVAKGIPESKIEVIPQGFQPVDVLPDRLAARRRYGFGDAFVVMFTGSYGLANNDTNTILDAALALREEPGLLFVLVGDGDRKEEYVARARAQGLDGVRFLPMVPKSEVPSLLAAADACIMALPPGDFWKIFLQNKFFDYLGSGRPIVAAVAGDQADLLGLSRAGFTVPPGDVPGLSQAILRLKRDPALAREMGERGARYARTHLLRSALLDRYVRLVEDWVAR
ncbi:MAG TPA: glycosyltransferase family 4 protein [Candidatus Polarisedimenticolaceae bacterium]|nr:glycosyltransferase family 4 protein [Candidatus Polarisedimenticolaceae bacterium]